MGQDSLEFGLLMQRVRAGSEEAAQELFERYGPHIFRVVRRRMTQKLRAKFDSADFVQAVWASFFAIPTCRQTFERPEALVAYLAQLASNKVVDAVRQRMQTAKYNVNRERSLDGSAAFQAGTVAGADPTPSQIIGAREEFAQLLKQLPARHQEIIVLLGEGHTHAEIAQRLNIDPKTIWRVLRQVATGGKTHGKPGPGPERATSRDSRAIKPAV